MSTTTDQVAVVGVGVDAVDVARFRQVLERRQGLARRLFTPDELAYAAGARDPAPRLAARFAAKEATMKVLGVGIGALSWHEVEVVRHDRGRPTLTLSGRAERLGTDLAIGCWHLSLTHTGLVAVASVVAERRTVGALAAGSVEAGALAAGSVEAGAPAAGARQVLSQGEAAR